MSAYMDTPHYRVNKYVSVLRVLGGSDRHGRIHVVNDIPLTLDDLEAVVRQAAESSTYAGLTRDALKRLADAVDDIATDDNLMRPAQRVAQLRGVATDARAALAKTTSPEIVRPPETEVGPITRAARTLGLLETPSLAVVPLNGPHNLVQTVPDHCDRIVWRNRYYHLPLQSESSQGNGTDAEAIKAFKDRFPPPPNPKAHT